TLERATPRAAAISSALSGRADRKSRAWIWATVRLIHQRAPISPQCRMKRFWIGVSPDLLVSGISVNTEISPNQPGLSSPRVKQSMADDVRRHRVQQRFMKAGSGARAIA